MPNPRTLFVLLMIGAPVLGCSPPPTGVIAPYPQTEASTVTHGALLGPSVSFPNLGYRTDELGKPLSILKSADATGARRGHSNVAVVRGHLLVPFAQDSGQPGGGLSFYDLSDPRRPVLTKSIDHPALREAHGFGFSTSYGSIHAAFQATDGIQIWDLGDVTNPTLRTHLALPGIEASDYAAGAWWVYWQAPFIYLGGSGNGLYVIDATDLDNPRLETVVPTSRTGGFRVGPVYAFGNLLVASSADVPGYAAFDISDPRRPELSALLANGPAIYSILLNGGRIYGAGIDGRLYVHDVSNPREIKLVGVTARGPDKGGYLSFQDGFVHGGFSAAYAKFDLRTEPWRQVLRGSSSIPGRDEDFGMVLGNLIFAGNDHGEGTALLPHQESPDTTPPAVNGINPTDGAVEQKPTTRVGISFTDQIDIESVNADSIWVRPVGGMPIAGKLATQTNLASFAPDAPLLPNTTYEIVLPAGGVRDLVGNPLASEVRARFSTGPFLSGEGLRCAIAPTTPVEVRQEAHLTVQLSQSDGVELTVDFGDGEIGKRPPAAGRISHRYRRAGHHTVLVTATRGTETTSCARVQTVHARLTERAPASASTIVFDAARKLTWVVNPDSDSVTAIDAVALTRKFEVPVGRNPRTLAVAPDGSIWVTNQHDSTISIIDGDKGVVATTLLLSQGGMPYGIAFSPDGRAAYVTMQATGQLLRIHPRTRQVIGTTELEGQIRGIAIDADSRRVYVTRFISPDEGGEVYELRTQGGGCQRMRTIRLSVDVGPDTEATGRGLPNYLSSITISPDGRRAFVAAKKDNVGRGLVRDGQRLTFESMVRTIVTQIDLGRQAEDLAARKDLNDRDLAQAVAFSRLGDYAAVVIQGSNEVQFLDAYTGALVSGIPNVGFAPQGLVFSDDHKQLFVNNFLSRTVGVYDVSGFIDSSSTTARVIGSVATVSREPLKPLVHLGKIIFHNATDRRMNRDGYISCASCHLDGDSDGRVWDFTQDGEGLRNTVAIAGRGGMRQGRVHWTGNFDEIQDFEHSTRNFFGGSGFIPDAAFAVGTRSQPLGDPKAGLSLELDALAAFVSSLHEPEVSPYRNADGTMTAEGLAGKKLFADLGCHVCHGGDELTDSGAALLHDVGTLGSLSGQRLGQPLTGLDTPGLKNLWLSAPYLHDGSAASLTDVLVSRNPSGVHGATGSLRKRDRQRLVSYLLQLDEPMVPTVNLSGLIVADTGNAADWSLQTGLGEGDLAYGDRQFLLQAIPGELLGRAWVRPANDSRSFPNGGPPLVSFVLDAPGDVHVALDVRAPLVGWIDATWTRAGTLQVRESALLARPMAIYKKAFPAGLVTLPSLARGGILNYLVVAR